MVGTAATIAGGAGSRFAVVAAGQGAPSTSSQSSSSSSSSSSLPPPVPPSAPNSMPTHASMATTHSPTSRLSSGSSSRSNARHRLRTPSSVRRALSSATARRAAATASGASAPRASRANALATTSRGCALAKRVVHASSAFAEISRSFSVSATGHGGSGFASVLSTPIACRRNDDRSSTARHRNRCDRTKSASMMVTARVRCEHSLCFSASISDACARRIASSSRLTARFSATRRSSSDSAGPPEAASHSSLTTSAMRW
eukprot:31194-Pelagococcus_subviridis.AAC.6